MESKHLTYFKVENFKRFDSLEVNDIGQFNLIVGDNNVGKTTLLEALLFDEGSYSTFLSNIAYSLFVKGILQSNVANYNFLDFIINNKSQPLAYKFKYANTDVTSLLIQKKLYSDLEDKYFSELSKFFVLSSPPTFPLLDFVIEFNVGTNKEYQFTSHVPLNFIANKTPYLSSNVIYDKGTASLFSQLAINTEKLESFINELAFFIPKLVSIETNYALVPDQIILAIREKGKDLIPLSQYGDGTIKLFIFLLELEFCENRRLMIDEIDTGIHYSRMKDFLKKVIQAAKNKNVQIFATTHSKECIEYYTQALEELNMQDSGRIIRIADTKSGIKSYTLNYAQFENALLAESEIR